MSNIYAAPYADLSQPVQPGAAVAFALNGRIGRLRYVAYVSAAYLLISLCLGLMMIPLNAVVADATTWLPATISVVVLIAYMIIARRRLQDIGLGGLFFLCMFIPFVNLYFGFVMLFKRGDEGSNEFGSQPPANTVGVKVMACALPLLLVLAMFAPVLMRKFG